LATHVLARVRSAFGVQLGVGSIFEESTVEGFARKIEEAMRNGEKDSSPPLIRAQREGSLPLSFAQQRLWFLDQLEAGMATYNIPLAVRLKGRLNFDVLKSVINEIVKRHEVLRTRIKVEAGEPVQVIDEWEARELEVMDLTGSTREEREEETRRAAREEAEAGFDLSRGPLMKVKVLRLEEEDHVVLFTMHHIVSDGWSMGILIREVSILYQAFCAGVSSPLGELPIQYADYAVWQRKWLQGEVLEEQLKYWKKQLEYVPELELPANSSLQKIEGPKSAWCEQVIPTGITRAIKCFKEEREVTLFMVLLAAFTIALHRLTGQRDLVIGTDIANRNRVELEPLIGFFVNELILRIKIEDDPTFDELLAQVRETALDAYIYQDIPFDKLVEALEPERRSGHTPFIRAKLVVQNTPPQSLMLPGLTVEEVEGLNNMNEGLKCDFLLTFFEQKQELVAHVTYNEAVVQKSTTVAVLRDIERLLSIVVEDSTLKLSALMSKLAELQRQQQKQRVASALMMIESVKKPV
jgi:NRPS condensation-like uncharacterized protein